MTQDPTTTFLGASALVSAKFVDIASRSLFVLIATFGLPLQQAGQFTTVSTLVTLFAFAVGFERHLDVQRRKAGESSRRLHRAVNRCLAFFAANWIFLTPPFVVLVSLWCKLPWHTACLMSLVVIGETLAAQSYNLAVTSSRYSRYVVLFALKNAVVCAAVLLYLVAFKTVSLSFVLYVWIVFNTVSIIVSSAMWRCLEVTGPLQRVSRIAAISAQHKASFTHFMIGVVAVLMIQFDRLTVAGYLGLENGGLYMRHVLLASLAYQAYNVGIFSRLAPQVYALAKTASLPTLRARLWREYRVVLAGTAVLVGVALVGNYVTGAAYTTLFHLDLAIMFALLGSFVIRAGADFEGLLLNARLQERDILWSQAVALGMAAATLVPLSYRFGITGAAASNCIGSCAYYLLNSRAARRLPA